MKTICMHPKTLAEIRKQRPELDTSRVQTSEDIAEGKVFCMESRNCILTGLPCDIPAMCQACYAAKNSPFTGGQDA